MNISLQNKIIAVVLLLLIACMSVFSFISYQSGITTRKKLAMDEMRRTASFIATVHSLERSPDWRKTENYLSTIISLYSQSEKSGLLELFYVLVKDNSGRLSAYKVNYGLARQYRIKLTDSSGIPLDEKSYENNRAIVSLIENSVPDMDTIVMPIMVNGQNRGTIELGYLVKRLAAEERAAIARNAAALALLCILGAITTTLISRKVIEPILAVVRAMGDVGEGNLDVKVSGAGADETGLLVDGFNSMATGLKRSRKEVAEKTRELEESENKYRSLFQSAGDTILLLDGNGACIDANQEAESLFGRPVTELLNTFIFDLVSPNKDITNFSACPERCSGVVSIPGAKPREIEALLSRVDRGMTIAVIRDVTPWREAEQAILAIKKRQQKLIESLPVGILTLDSDLKVTACNRYMESLVEKPAGEIISSSWENLNPLFGNGGLEEELRGVLDQGRETTISGVTLETAEHSRRLLEMRIAPLVESPEESPSLMLVVEDITNKVEMRRIHEELQQRSLQSQKLEAIGTLAGGIASDFKDLLSVILGNLDSVLEKMEPGSPYYAGTIDTRKAAIRAKALTIKLLAFARKEKLNKHVVSIVPIIHDIVEFVERSIGSNIEIVVSLNEDTPSTKADPHQIFHALLNICNNAADSMPDGGTITIESTIIEDEESQLGPQGRFCLIKISDTGKGMPEHILSRIFDPFFTTNPPGSGTGLGLSTALGIIENHGGQVSVSSKEGEGTSMEIYLPASEEEPEQVADETVAALFVGTETVLVVDDVNVFLEMQKLLLAKAGYHPVTARSGEEAVETFKKIGSSIDLILLDMALPGMNGVETYNKLKESGASIPFVIVSGYSGEVETSDLLKEENVKAFIRKPFNSDQFYRAVRKALDSEKKEIE
ncbi:ATP-binding protein [bacterium]